MHGGPFAKVQTRTKNHKSKTGAPTDDRAEPDSSPENRKCRPDPRRAVRPPSPRLFLEQVRARLRHERSRPVSKAPNPPCREPNELLCPGKAEHCRSIRGSAFHNQL